VSNNKIAPTDLAMLIIIVGDEMVKIGNPVEPPAEEKPEPAVSVRRSIQPNHLVCLVCGKPQKMLKRHLAVRHELTPAQYRDREPVSSKGAWLLTPSPYGRGAQVRSPADAP
jgi:predicted transcriptional regulator